MIRRHSFSHWVAATCIGALQLAALVSVSGQVNPRPSAQPLIRRPLIVAAGEQALVRARAAMKAQNFAQAFTEYGTALKLNPPTGSQHEEALRGFSESGVKLAQQRLKEGRSPEAERIAREVLAVNANYRPAQEVLAQAKTRTKKEVPTIGAGPPTIKRVLPRATPPQVVEKSAPFSRPTARETPQPTPPPDEEEAPMMAEQPPDLPEEQPPPTETAPATTAPAKKALVKVYFATDRQHISGATGPSKYFGPEWNGDPDPDGQHLLTGFVEVSIPPVHKEGELERPFKLWIIELKEDEKKHIVLKKLSVMKADDFYGELRKEYDKRTPENRSAFVFIHGFKTSFDDAAYRTAQLAYDLNFEGVPMMYSWPSKDNLLAYASDRATADWSWKHLQYFVERVARESGARRIHLIAHSMGNQLLVNALDGLGRQPEIKPLFDNVIMAAPDVDAKTFTERNWAGIRDAAKRFTLYASSDDWALKVSRDLKGGNKFIRLGEAGETLVIIPGLDTVDASGIDTNELGHSYYHCKKLMDDLQLLMAKGWAPLERKLRDRHKGDLAYWAFP
jgi:esterase/lipase superfamily enzyme